MKKEWKKKASFEYRIPNIFCTFKLFIGNKYEILLPSLAGVAVATPADNSPSVSNRGAQITRKHTQKLPILG